eukprot:TRINITY_DN6293_c0_g1_i4.p1 TRINITY_DN6293_c0_g1~~TRINITY_DN6293_c0_g1_i4.p1  ORF type:complete len:140 (+),score=18.37 TRINITY_DN6293_c0_g1_i4:49-468(+)
MLYRGDYSGSLLRVPFSINLFFLLIGQPPRSTLSSSSAASDVYKRQELSKDHKPEQPKELARILRMGGRVEPIVDWEGGGGYLGPNRVWLQGQNFPGLAMSRSFGDSIASSVGVSPIPGLALFILLLLQKLLKLIQNLI